MTNYNKLFPNMTQQALNNSEVFSNYSKIVLQNEIEEKEVLASENEQLKKSLEQKIAENPHLKKTLIAAKKKLAEDKNALKTTDPNFVKALEMLNFEE